MTITRTRRFLTAALAAGTLTGGLLTLAPADAAVVDPDLPLTDCPEPTGCTPPPTNPGDLTNPEGGDDCHVVVGCDGFDLTDRPDPEDPGPEDPEDPGEPGQPGQPGDQPGTPEAVNPDVVVGSPAFTG